MDKEKEIEEMEDFISKNKRIETSEWIANGLYDMGYRKIIPNIDFVVRCSDIINVREKAYNDARKETAKEILDKLLETCPQSYLALRLFVRKQQEEYGVKVDE